MIPLKTLSIDAEALFPSLHIKDILESIYDLVLTSKAKFKDINMTAITRYIKVMYTDQEIKKYNVISCLPKRQSVIDGVKTRKVTIAYLDMDTFTRTKNGITEKNVPKWNIFQRSQVTPLRRIY